jgi:UDP-N-acetylmuramyl pentapeptide phosphotransferase/UDP-N-acetylglucosamine-1-phosphate transferase
VLPLAGWRSIIASHQALAIVFIGIAVPVLVTMLVILLRAASERRRLLRGFDDRLRVRVPSGARRRARTREQ